MQPLGEFLQRVRGLVNRSWAQVGLNKLDVQSRLFCLMIRTNCKANM